MARLQTDYIDIFYIHFPDENTPKDEAVAALNDLKKSGKIRAVGVSNFSLEQIKEANKNGQVDYVEDAYSLVHREAKINYGHTCKKTILVLCHIFHWLLDC